MDSGDAKNVVFELRQISREIRWLREAADRAFPMNEDQQIARQKEIERMRVAGR